MLVPFGTRVVDSNGKGVGTVSRLVLHSQSRQVAALVVHQGVLNRREVVVPIDKVADFGTEVRLALRASELDGLDLFNSASLQAMPDHWEMPAGFDQRDFFLAGGSGWTAAVLPFEPTSPAVSGTPAYIRDRDTPAEPREPDISAGTHVYDKAGQRVGEVESMEIAEASGRIVRESPGPPGPPLPHGDGDTRQHDRVGRRADRAQRRRRCGEEARARLTQSSGGLRTVHVPCCACSSSGGAACGAGGVMAWETGRWEGARGRGEC